MTDDFPRLGEPGLAYVRESLREGRSLARLVDELLTPDDLDVRAVAPMRASDDEVMKFRHGFRGAQGGAHDKLLTCLMADYRGRHLILELPMDRPSDSWLVFPQRGVPQSTSRRKVLGRKTQPEMLGHKVTRTYGPTPARMLCGDDVFALCAIGDDAQLIKNTLHYHDATFLYSAFVVAGLVPTVSPQRRVRSIFEGLRGRNYAEAAAECPTELLRAGQISVEAIINGAYDGEGYVLSTLSQPLTGAGS